MRDEDRQQEQDQRDQLGAAPLELADELDAQRQRAPGVERDRLARGWQRREPLVHAAPSRRLGAVVVAHGHHSPATRSRKTSSSARRAGTVCAVMPAPASTCGRARRIRHRQLHAARRRRCRRTDPAATSAPLCMTTTWVHVCSTSASRWLETITVRPVSRVALQDLAHLGDLRRVEAVGGLVEDEQLGQAEHRLSDRQSLLHAVAVGLHPAVDRRAEPGDLQRRLEVGVVVGAPGRRPVQPQVLPPGQVRQEAGPFDERAEPGQHRRARQRPARRTRGSARASG